MITETDSKAALRTGVAVTSISLSGRSRVRLLFVGISSAPGKLLRCYIGFLEVINDPAAGASPAFGSGVARPASIQNDVKEMVLRLTQALARQLALEDHERACAALAHVADGEGATS